MELLALLLIELLNKKEADEEFVEGALEKIEEYPEGDILFYNLYARKYLQDELEMRTNERLKGSKYEEVIYDKNIDKRLQESETGIEIIDILLEIAERKK